MPSGWSADYSNDYLYMDGVDSATLTKLVVTNGSELTEFDPSVWVKEVSLTKRDLEAGWSPSVRKFVVFQSSLSPHSEDTLAIGSDSFVVLGVEERNDRAQWLVFAQLKES